MEIIFLAFLYFISLPCELGVCGVRCAKWEDREALNTFARSLKQLEESFGPKILQTPPVNKRHLTFIHPGACNTGSKDGRG